MTVNNREGGRVYEIVDYRQLLLVNPPLQNSYNSESNGHDMTSVKSVKKSVANLASVTSVKKSVANLASVTSVKKSVAELLPYD